MPRGQPGLAQGTGSGVQGAVAAADDDEIDVVAPALDQPRHLLGTAGLLLVEGDAGSLQHRQGRGGAGLAATAVAIDQQQGSTVADHGWLEGERGQSGTAAGPQRCKSGTARGTSATAAQSFGAELILC